MTTEQKRLYKNYQDTINSRNVILLIKDGSELLGLKQDSSDRDEIGVFLEDPMDLVGLTQQDCVIYRTAEDRTGKRGEPSGPDDIDLKLYGLRKFLKLALGGNPSMLQLLFAPDAMCLIKTFIGSELQALAPSIISKEASKAFLGYALQQRLRLMGEAGQKAVNRAALEKKHGFDTKYAMHMVRLGYQGRELMQTGKLKFPMDPEFIVILNYIRNGKYTKDQCLNLATSAEHSLKVSAEDTTLRHLPDFDAVDKWMVETYLNAWRGRENQTASQQQGVTADTTGKDARASSEDRQEIERALQA